jgi:ABC-type polysaccharide/polyol phosphate transport system ATPase subunit
LAPPRTVVTALDSIDLELPEGRTVALIGPNGAGKTTLLRIVAGTFEPTEGTCLVASRVACFLLPSVGGSPALSVRDNALLFSAIAGLTRAEGRTSLPSVLERAELLSDAETVLEKLSLGMQQRLFFSVLLEAMIRHKAGIFLFDECLSGADAHFTARAEGLLEANRRPDQTVVYASHDLDHLERVCDDALYVNEGRLVAYGPVSTVLSRYRAEGRATTAAAAG